MQRNYLLLIAVLLLFAGFWYAENNIYSPLPEKISDLEDEQVTFNERLITAQILSEEMDQVYSIFENNMYSKEKSSIKETASIEFLNDLTDILNKLEITVLHIKPGQKEDRLVNILYPDTPDETEIKYTFIPYELEIECTFEEFGRFITALEKNDRLISIDEFLLNNGLERMSLSKSREDLMNQVIEMKLSTVTLNKSRG